MKIIRRIKLHNTNYYISINCEYKIKNGIMHLTLKNYKDDYYDDGDLSNLILKLEKNYNRNICKKYGDDIFFLSDCLYIYDNIPFIEGIGDFNISSLDNIISSASYITKDELNSYINANNILMNDNTNFKLGDERTWNFN